MSGRRRILLADDDPNTLYVLRTCLTALGHEVITASNGSEAMGLFESQAPALVLLDVKMPNVDGLEVLRAIRKHPERADTPVILLTGYADRDVRLSGLEAGANDYLEKPLDVAVLLARVRTLLRFQDIRESLRLARDETRARHAQLEKLQQEQRELIEFIVHDFKGPLTAMSANVEWVYEQVARVQPSTLGALQDVLESIHRLHEMVGELLLISQLEDGELRLHLHSVPAESMLQSVARRFRAAAEQCDIQLVSPTDTSIALTIDSALLQRVLENLIENALRYTPRGGRVVLNVYENRQIVIEVANTGHTIPIEDRQRIFEKFKRGTRDPTSIGHAGLGLYFCRRVVEAHGGDIRVLETREFPTCFRIELPKAISAQSSVPAPSHRESEPPQASGAFERGPTHQAEQRSMHRRR